MYGYNPYQQQQAMQYAQDQYGRFNNFSQPQQPCPPPVKPFASVLPVPDELTARSAQIPMDGSDTFFYNKSSGEIYVKRLSMVDGSIVFESYKRRESEFPAKERYATVAQLDEISERLKKLEGGQEE